MCITQMHIQVQVVVQNLVNDVLIIGDTTITIDDVGGDKIQVGDIIEFGDISDNFTVYLVLQVTITRVTNSSGTLTIVRFRSVNWSNRDWWFETRSSDNGFL